VGWGELAGAQGLGGLGKRAAEQGPGGPHGAGGGAGAQVEPAPQPAGGGGRLGALVGPGRAPGVDGGELPEPEAFLAVQQLPQHEDSLGPNRDGQPGQVSGGHAVDRRCEGRQVVGRPCGGFG
jgi:hypothetical protein